MKPTTITLPGERAAQLRTLADAYGTTISELIERMINNEIAAGRLPDQLPGFEIVPAVGHVFVTVQGFSFPALNVRQARQIADLLEEISTAKDAGGKKALFENEIELKAWRKGRGIRIDGDDPQTGRSVKASLTPGMAKDLARIIRNEAAKASKH